ncbi:tripartite motif-containing protein 44 [Gymnodraco acuticeps]|uniref:Tripartite motif-containing protein 44 n=1 Tax=Gymnodraco acuticeps TaxID=8218 RepID=A0A6P8U4Y1_GYMAC|nr:tripartite motif-containing protein 44 [Gymnodraco acuticeps]XP_034071871.1 tripartite motif-containing protein 44 [Gymnodraco acuticeps]XP_034071872.1 tripartite motif-containing protein 44 [Gymnodraco acuticeps]
MDQKEVPQDGALGLKHEELPQMDGSCDACEPDEAQPATHVCYTCSFAFCSIHADRHASSTHHPIMPYNHEGTQANGLGNSRDFRVGDGAEDEAGVERAFGMAANQDMALLGGAMAKVDESGDAVEKDGAQNGVQLEAEPGDGAQGAEAGQEAAAAGEAGKNNNVTVERLRCKEHEQEGSLYCKNDEKVICVVCAVQGEHREHEIITLFEAYVWQKSREGYDLLGCTQRMSETIKTRWTNPEMSVEELEAYVNSQFDELRRLVRLEEKRTLHLVDLKEAFLTASAAEKIAEISVETERLQEEMANITHQLCLLEKAEALGPAGAAVALAAVPAHRVQRDIEARPRFPEPRAHPMDPRDFDDNDSGPSMDHAP